MHGVHACMQKPSAWRDNKHFLLPVTKTEECTPYTRYSAKRAWAGRVLTKLFVMSQGLSFWPKLQ